MTENVKSLPVKIELQPVPEVIDVLEQLLEKARTGYIRAIAFSYVRQGYRSSYGHFGAADQQAANALHSGLMTLWTSMGAEMDRLSSDADCNDPTRD